MRNFKTDSRALYPPWALLRAVRVTYLWGQACVLHHTAIGRSWYLNQDCEAPG